MSQLFSQAKRTLSLAGPLIIAQIAVVGMAVTDTLMAGRASAIDLAGVAVGTGVFVPVVVFIIALVTGITPILAQHFGAKDYNQLGESTRQGMWLAILLGVAAAIVLQLLIPFVQYLDADPEVKAVAQGYLQVILFGLPGLAAQFTLRSFCEAQGDTTPTMWVNGGAFLINIGLDYALVFGEFGLPALGGVGCGIATAILHWLALIAFIVVSRRARYKKAKLYSKRSAPDKKAIKEIVGVGLPSAIGVSGEAGFFSISALLIASLGVSIVSAHQITMNVGAMLFMIPLGIAQAVSIRVGHAIGEDKTADARYIGFTTTGLVLVLGVVTGVITYLLRYDIAQLYSTDAEIIRIAASLMFLCAMYQLVDFAQVVAWGALRGFKDTRVPMYLQLFSFWVVGFPVAYSLSFTDFWGEAMGVEGYWIGFIVGLSTAAILLILRFNVVSRRNS